MLTGVRGAYGEGGLMTRLGAGGMAGLKNPIGMLGKFGGALTLVTGALNGLVTFFQTGDIFKGLGATAGPIAGTIIGTAIAGPIGGIIGGWLGSQKPVIDAFTGALAGMWWGISNAWDALGPIQIGRAHV